MAKGENYKFEGSTDSYNDWVSGGKVENDKGHTPLISP